MAAKEYKASVAFGGSVDGSLSSAISNVTGGMSRMENSVQQNIRTLRSQKKVISSLDFSSLRKTHDQMSQTQKRVESLKKEFTACKTPTAKMRKELALAERNAKKASDAFGKQTKRLHESRDQMKKAGIDTAHLKQETARLTSELARQEKRQDSLNRMRQHGGAVAKSMKSAVSGLIVAGAAATAVVGTAIGGIVALTSSIATNGDTVAKTADKLGMGIGALQELRYAAERSGVSTANFDTSMEKMTKNISDAATGSGPAADALKELGLSASYLKEIGPEKAMDELADALKHVKNPADRLRIATELFGRSGAGMVNMLKDGSAGLNQFKQDAQDTGSVLSDDAARNAEAYQDAMLNMQLSIGGVKNIVGSALLPVVTEAFQKITAWIAENKEVVVDWAAQFAGKVKTLIPKVVDFAKGMTSVFLGITKTIGVISSAVGGFDNLAKILAGVVALRAGSKIYSVAKNTADLAKAAHDFATAGSGVKSTVSAMAGVSKTTTALSGVTGVLPALKGGFLAAGGAVKAFVTPLLTNPLTWVVAGVAGAVYLLWKNWDTVVSVVKKAWDAISTFCGPFIDGLKNAWGGLVEFFGSLWSGVKSTWTGLWDNFPNVGTIVGGIKSAWTGITEFFGSLWEGVKATWTGLWDSLPDAGVVVEKMKGAWSGITGFFDKLWEGIKKSFGSVMNWMKGKIDWLSGAVSKVLGIFGIGKEETPEEKKEREKNAQIAGKTAQSSIGKAFSDFDDASCGIAAPASQTAPQTIAQAEQMVNNATQSKTVTQTNHFEIHAVPGQDVESLVSIIIERLKEQEDRGGVLFDRAGV